MNTVALRVVVLAAAVVLVSACNGSDNDADAGASPSSNQKALADQGNAPPVQARFVAIGDSGEGGERAYAVGQAIADVCAAKQGAEQQPDRAGCDFVVGLGDNIYESGANGVDDPQFVEKFEKPFGPVHLPFYMVLGNHDNTGYFAGDGADNDHGDVEVDYTFYDGRPTDRWTMPDRYYQQDVGETADGRPLVSLFGLDSNPIAGGFADADPDFSYHTYGRQELNWATDALTRSQAVFKIAMAHHPYVSNGDHGNAGNYDGIPGDLLPVLAGTRWKQFMQDAVCDRADFYLAGHDHDMEVLNAVPACGRTQFVLSGAGSKTRALDAPNRNKTRFQKGGVVGFFWMQASAPDSRDGSPAQMCLEAYVVDPDAEGLGVIANGKAQPAFTHCYDKAPPENIAASSDFMDKAVDGDAKPLPPPDDSFNPDYSGPLAEYRATLVSGFQKMLAEQPQGPQRQAMQQMLAGMDHLMGGLDGLSAAMMGGDAGDMNQSLQSVLAAAQQLQAVDTAGLPEPFNRLGGVFDAFANGLGNGADFQDKTGSPKDMAFIAGPLVKMARNLHNIEEGAEGEEENAGQMPAFAPLLGLTEVLTTVSNGLGQSLAQVAMLNTSATGEVLVGTLQLTLEQVVNDVLEIEDEDAALPGDLLSAALLSVTREVTAQLDNRVIGNLKPLLEPVTGLLGEVLN